MFSEKCVEKHKMKMKFKLRKNGPDNLSLHAVFIDRQVSIKDVKL